MCVAVGLIGAGVVGAIGAEGAASTQAGAAENAQAISQNEFNTITQQEAPYLQSGYGALGQLNYLQGIGTPGQGNTATGSPSGGFGSLNQPFTAQYMQQYSPAYQFQLQQGQQGVLNQDAGAQGALSGAALKDLTSFNQNYANTAFNNAFSQYQTQQQNTYNRLSGIAGLGQAAASQQAQSGTALAGQAAQSAQNIGTAQAGGIVGATNALSGAGTLAALYGGLNNQAGGFTAQDVTAYNSPGFNTAPMTSAGGGYLVNTPGYGQ